MSWIIRRTLFLTMLALAGISAGAQEPPPPGEPPSDEPAPRVGAAGPEEELGRAIRQHFLNRLRAELALSDEQMGAVAPLVEQIESTRSRLRRERLETVRSLQRGMEQGAGDDELQALLDRLEAIDEEQRLTEGEVMTEIDAQLTVRQRVQFRFYTERFRRNLERRINEMQRERGGRMRGPASRKVPSQNRP
jgi:hypothetical protein